MRRSSGFGSIDLTVTLVVAFLLLTLGVPAYNGFTSREKVSEAIRDVGALSVEIERFRLHNDNRIPDTLNELTMDVPMDPWDRPYVFLKISGVGPGFAGLRKDGELNPLNTDFDLYSRGEDGESTGPLSARASRDDIVRANNGAYIGPGKDY
jgi:general secretion pathway protein G